MMNTDTSIEQIPHSQNLRKRLVRSYSVCQSFTQADNVS